MTRPIGLIIAVVILSGCRGSSPTAPIDPFFGRTRVEPPRTGSAALQPATGANYVTPSLQVVVPNSLVPQSGTSQTVSAAAAGAPAPSVADHNQPRVGPDVVQGTPVEPTSVVALNRPGDRVTIPSAAREPTDRLAGSTVATLVGTPPATSAERPLLATSSRQRIARTIEPRPAGTVRRGLPTPAAASGEPRRLGVPEGAIDIMDLPASGASSGTQPAAHFGGIQLVSGTEELDGASARGKDSIKKGRNRDSFSRRARYAHDPDYGWIRGKLEYSQIDRRWKLRYIPIDGTTDKFGGSVVLSNPAELSGYERGQFVEIHGSLGSASSDDHSYAPDFEILQVKRLTD